MTNEPSIAVIRRATAADAEVLSEIGMRTFIETFGHLYPDEDLQAYLQENYSPTATSRLLADDRYAIWLLEQDNGPAPQTVGYAVGGPCGLPHADATPDEGELKRLYLLPELHNSGWGSRLCQVVLDWLERDGPRMLWISVWSENVGAQRFYQRYGFEKVGEYEFPVGRVRDREFMFRRCPSLPVAGSSV